MKHNPNITLTRTLALYNTLTLTITLILIFKLASLTLTLNRTLIPNLALILHHTNNPIPLDNPCTNSNSYHIHNSFPTYNFNLNSNIPLTLWSKFYTCKFQINDCAMMKYCNELRQLTTGVYTNCPITIMNCLL